jgi:hypothetical protein
VEELLEKKHATTEELSFLCGLPWAYIPVTEMELQSVNLP